MMQLKTMIILIFSLSLITSSIILDGNLKMKAAMIDAIPNTTRTVMDYNNHFLSVTGFASLGVNDRSRYLGTSYYREVRTGKDFLQAVADASNGDVKVIKVLEDLNLGWKALNLNSEEQKKYSFISKYSEPMNGYTNPLLEASGVSQLNIDNVEGLTIFSNSGRTISHVEIKLQRSSNDLVFRNLNFDGMWQWDDTGEHKEAGWSFFKINGANNVWIDHCRFSIAADGLIDLKNGSTNVTLSWNEFGLEASENPPEDSGIYQSIHFMEEKYTSNQLDSDSVYYNMRNAGATIEQIMAYAAYHSKSHLNGSGDKDYMNYVGSNGVEIKDGNQRIRLTIAYSRYHNIGQRVPMIRQGSGHLYNILIDNSTHHKVLDNVEAIAKYGTDNLSRALNARNGASIAADTSVFNDIYEPITGAEIQGMDTENMNAPWSTLFREAYNHNLIVNSRITNKDGTYTGSSWDNNGENLFTKGFNWYDKATIGNWAWSSHIVGVENMDKENPPTDPFMFEYNYEETLPYAYNVLPLNSVEPIVTEYAGVDKVKMGTVDWLKTHYDPILQNLVDLVDEYWLEGEITNEHTAHALSLHLTAVSQFEKKQDNKKIIKHMEGFKELLAHQKKNLSDHAYDYLYQSANATIATWQQ
ncbi:FIMAH domain-containing protein [Bacillus sp. SD088]|uniref:FIMAH domain-containing protein n=1 Tax=Bacillus sp. SD088 TaxID=2782012 RepID=UPI001F61FEA7|nr:hypothetical protein [Bacillus sp. SD088]